MSHQVESLSSKVKEASLLIFHVIQHAILGAILALWGAKISGLPASDWSLEPLIYLLFGLIAGPISFVVFYHKFKSDGASSSSLAPYILPYLISILVGFFGYKFAQWDSRRNAQYYKASTPSISYDDCYQKLLADPQIAIREGWYKKNDQHEKAYRDSLTKNDVAFTPKMLARLAVLDDRGRIVLYQHEKIDITFLEIELSAAIAKHKSGRDSSGKIRAILKNPQAKQSWRILLEESGIKIP
jgi:phage pi2 protein 07